MPTSVSGAGARREIVAEEVRRVLREEMSERGSDVELLPVAEAAARVAVSPRRSCTSTVGQPSSTGSSPTGSSRSSPSCTASEVPTTGRIVLTLRRVRDRRWLYDSRHAGPAPTARREGSQQSL